MMSSKQTEMDSKLEPKDSSQTVSDTSIPEAPAFTQGSFGASKEIKTKSLPSFEAHVSGDDPTPVTTVNIPLRMPRSLEEMSKVTGLQEFDVLLNLDNPALSVIAVENLMKKHVSDLIASAEPTQHLHAKFFLLKPTLPNNRPSFEPAQEVKDDEKAALSPRM